MIPPVYVLGIVNPKGVRHSSTRTFELTEREIAIVADTKAYSMALMVEHNYDPTVVDGMHAVGSIVRFWQADDGKLWALAVVNPRSRFGPATIRRLLMGEFTGFSPGTPFDSYEFGRTNSVDLFGMCEVSLVHEPDEAATVLVAITGAESLCGWPKVQKRIVDMYEAMGEELPSHVLDCFLTHKELWPLVSAARGKKRKCDGKFSADCGS
jgi:hypothetical protein